MASTACLQNALAGQPFSALEETGDPLLKARHCRDQIFRRMQEARALADEAEGLVDRDAWPFRDTANC
jgi:glutamine synthetase type III